MNYEFRTEKNFKDAVESLKASLNSSGFGVLWELNFKDKIKEKGLEFNTNFKIFEVCNPQQAKEVLEKKIEVGYFLPCKIVAYEKDNSVYIGMLKPSDFMGVFNDKDLIDIAKEVEAELKSAIESAI